MPREDVSHLPNRQQTWVQSLPCDWHRHRPFVHQVLLWVEEVRWNSGGAPTWGLRRRCQGRGRGRYSRGARRWAGSPCPTGHNKMPGRYWVKMRSTTSRRTATPNTQRHRPNGQRKCSEVCFAIAKHGAGTGRKVSGLVISTSFPLFKKKNGRLDIHIESRVVSREIYVWGPWGTKLSVFWSVYCLWCQCKGKREFDL